MSTKKLQLLNNLGFATENYVTTKVDERVPSTDVAHQQLVTDENGVSKWEDRIIRPTEYVIVEVLPECQPTVTVDEGSGDIAATVTTPFTSEVVDGETYTVYWNGTTYNTAAQLLDFGDEGTVLALGDVGGFTGGVSTGEPFMLAVAPEGTDGLYAQILVIDGSTEITLKIVQEKTIYHRLPYEYLPEDMYREENIVKTILPENTPELTDDGYLVNTPLEGELTVGNTYTVVWNSTEYECEYKEYSYTDSQEGEIIYRYLGDGSKLGAEADTSVPFVICIELLLSGTSMMPEGVYCLCVPTDETTEITLSISGETVNIHKVPDKYLPTKIAWVNDTEKIIMPEQTFTDLSSGGTPINATLTNELEIGVEYTVTWNGVDYVTTAQAPRDLMSGMIQVIVGNGAVLGNTTTDDPFCFAVMTADGVTQINAPYMLMFDDGSTTVTMKIIEPVGAVHKIDEKFLPELTAEDIDAVPVTRTVNGKTLNANIFLSYSDVGAAPVSRTINGKTLTANITLTASDVGALPDTTEIPSIDGLATETYVDEKVSAIDNLVDSVNGKIGDVVLTASDVGADSTGTAKELMDALNIKNGTGSGSVRTKDSNVASGDYSYAEGYRASARGTGSHAEGYYTCANGMYSHAEGGGTLASGNYVHAEGYSHGFTTIQITGEANSTTYTVANIPSYIKIGTVVSLNDIFANITQYTDTTITVSTTLSDVSITDESAKLYYGIASGHYSHAEGFNTTATDKASHAEGGYTCANGMYSHAEGGHTCANGAYAAHAEGYKTTASGSYSHAEGYGTIAGSMYQHVQGRYNIENTSYAHIIGNGSRSTDEEGNTVVNRSNAHTLDWQGNGWFAGAVKVGGTGQDDEEAQELATQQYVQDYVNEAILGGAW